MKYKSLPITAACILALSVCLPITSPAQGKKTASPSPAASPSATPKAAVASTEKAPRAIPFRGTASAVDQSGKAFTIAGKETSRVFKATDKTTITKAGSPATFAELNDSDAVTGSYWKQEDGTLELKSLKIGGKTDAEKAGSTKKAKSDNTAEASPSPSPKK